MGVIATIGGVLLVLIGFMLPDGNGEVSNLAAMNLKTNLVIVGSAFFVGGVVASSATRIERALSSRGAAEAMDRAIDRQRHEPSRGVQA